MAEELSVLVEFMKFLTRNRVQGEYRQMGEAVIHELGHRHQKSSFHNTTDQHKLDELREHALVYLYRLLFIFKAEAQGLLPMLGSNGEETLYTRKVSSRAIFTELESIGAADRAKSTAGFDKLKKLFSIVNGGDANLEIPAYNGGLFDPGKHQELDGLELLDDSLHDVFTLLIYLDGASLEVPYMDLDVRDLGDIYEGLLEQRLVSRLIGIETVIALVNQKGERKSSGSYFTPDRLVEYIDSKTIEPLIEKRVGESNAKHVHRVFSLKILDPSMGSGHFLVKAIDIIATHLTLNCDPLEPNAPHDNGPLEFAYWKAKVAENCIYGVDYNPMSVELAKVAIWLHTARKDKPLTFLDHHLKLGNSLVGADLRHLALPAFKSKITKKGVVWQPVVVAPPEDSAKTAPIVGKPGKGRKNLRSDPNQLELPFDIDTSLMSGIMKSVKAILARSSDNADDVKRKDKDYADAVAGRMEAAKALADLWCAQCFIADPTPENILAYEAPDGLYAKLKAANGKRDNTARKTALNALLSHPLMVEIRRIKSEGYGPRPFAFFHWQLEFPEAVFDENGGLRPDGGFDAVIGNPPWDKIKPAKRDFYGPYSQEVANTQGAGLNRLIDEMERQSPWLIQEWTSYEKGIASFVNFLATTGIYTRQSMVINGKKTGGDPDLFRYFTERALQLAAPDRRIGLVTPGTLWQSEGCAALRHCLLKENSVESLHVFENYRKWAFDIDSRFKFAVFTAIKSQPSPGHAFSAGFMLRNTRCIDGLQPERELRIGLDDITALSPDSLAMLDFKCQAELVLATRLHKNFPALASPNSGWNAKYRRELDMTIDAWLFKSRDWMRRHGFTQVSPILPYDKADQSDQSGASFKNCRQRLSSGYPNSVKLPEYLPPGGEYWVAADPEFYRQSGYVERVTDINGISMTFFIHPDDIAEAKGSTRLSEDHFRIFPHAFYTALYEGRMVHNFDHCQKAYISGEARMAIWDEMDIQLKYLNPRLFVCKMETGAQASPRVAFCEITGATNERTVLSSLLPPVVSCGNKVPTLTFAGGEHSCLCMMAILNSFVADAMMRYRVSTTLNWVYFKQLTIPILFKNDEFVRLAARLSCTTPELSGYWDAVFPESPWTYESAERDLWKRAELRAELDAIVAALYDLSVEEYARVLTAFPLQDRNWKPLPGDCFLTETDEPDDKGALLSDGAPKYFRNDAGWFECRPRSFVTRDLALLTYMRHKGHPPPLDLGAWFRDRVGIDPDGPLSRFHIGAVRPLLERVNMAKAIGSIPYVPSLRSSSAGDDAEAGSDDLIQ